MNRKYYVIFHKRQKISWWNFYLDEEICHCFLITSSADGAIEINPSRGGIRIRTYKESSEKIALSYLQNGAKVVEWYLEDIETPRIKILRTCTGIAKDFLGINNPMILTSKQLYNYLVKESI